MKLQGKWSQEYNISIVGIESMFYTVHILVNLISVTCSLEYGVKKPLNDIMGFPGISLNWNNKCPKIWNVAKDRISSCYPRNPKFKNCGQLSELYNITGINELYFNIQTETRNCSNLASYSDCTGKFNVSVYYEVREKDFKDFVFSDEIPKKVVPSESLAEPFYKTDDVVGFSVNQNYKRLKLGFQAPSYCGAITSVSLYFYICPANTRALVKFAEVNAPSKISSPLESFGICIDNAIKISSSHVLSRKCYYNGSFEVVGGCECDAGYTNFYDEKKCQG